MSLSVESPAARGRVKRNVVELGVLVPLIAESWEPVSMVGSECEVAHRSVTVATFDCETNPTTMSAPIIEF